MNCKNSIKIYVFRFKMLIITFLMVSISSALLSAIKSVNAKSVALSIITRPNLSYNNPFFNPVSYSQDYI